MDEVHIEVETCEDLRDISSPQGLSSAGPTKYSYIHKIIDGITVNVNTVNITFKSPAFIAKVQVTYFYFEIKLKFSCYRNINVCNKIFFRCQEYWLSPNLQPGNVVI